MSLLSKNVGGLAKKLKAICDASMELSEARGTHPIHALHTVQKDVDRAFEEHIKEHGVPLQDIAGLYASLQRCEVVYTIEGYQIRSHYKTCQYAV